MLICYGYKRVIGNYVATNEIGDGLTQLVRVARWRQAEADTGENISYDVGRSYFGFNTARYGGNNAQ